MLSPEDSKRVADALIREIQTVSDQIQTSVRYGIPNAFERGVKDAVQNSLGYKSHSPAQGFQLFLCDVKTALAEALKR